MINQKYKDMLGNKSVIRELSEFATARGKEIGYENVFDYTLGNPSVPVPQQYQDELIRLVKEDNGSLHGYAPTLGLPEVKQQIADSLKKRFGIPYEANHIFPTAGAAAALAHAMRAVGTPGQEIVLIAPFFSEYISYIGDTGMKPRIIEADFPHFQIRLDLVEKAINENTAAILINSPNNPTGAVFTEDTLKQLAEILHRKAAEYGHHIFIISDEPYREISFDGKKVPYTACYYEDTLTCYSLSKSMSAPGDRIGYVAVNPACEDAEFIVPMMGQISRGLGHNCPTGIVTRAMGNLTEVTADLGVYEVNMNLLYDTFRDIGFEVERPGGTFYMMPKALEEDEVAFCKKALAYDLVFVPGGGFYAPGYFRVAYCVQTEKVERSLPVLRKFCREVYGK